MVTEAEALVHIKKKVRGFGTLYISSLPAAFDSTFQLDSVGSERFETLSSQSEQEARHQASHT